MFALTGHAWLARRHRVCCGSQHHLVLFFLRIRAVASPFLVRAVALGSILTVQAQSMVSTPYKPKAHHLDAVACCWTDFLPSEWIEWDDRRDTPHFMMASSQSTIPSGQLPVDTSQSTESRVGARWMHPPHTFQSTKCYAQLPSVDWEVSSFRHLVYCKLV